VPQRVTVAKVGDIPDGGAVVVSVRQKDVAIFNVGGKFQAIDDMCPHMGASLSGGFVEDGCVTCPWHYWRFRLADGSWADNGFMQYTQIGRVAWRESGSVTLLLVSNERQLARSLTVPIPFYGEARRVLRDRIAAHDIQLSDAGLSLGRDAREDV